MGIAHDVHAAMHTVKLPPPHPPINRVITQTKRPELSATHDTVLPPCELRDGLVRGGLRQFAAHIADK